MLRVAEGVLAALDVGNGRRHPVLARRGERGRLRRRGQQPLCLRRCGGSGHLHGVVAEGLLAALDRFHGRRRLLARCGERCGLRGVDERQQAVRVRRRRGCGHLHRVGQVDDAIRYFTAARALRPDAAIASSSLGTALSGKGAYREAVAALRKAIELELDQARYEARLAARRYESVDPDQRLVAAELEARWNAVLQKMKEQHDAF